MKEVTGNLFELFKESKVSAIAHGCNCQNTMGSGIALQMKELYPEAWEVDQRTVKGDVNKLGEFSEVWVERGGDVALADGLIFNLYTQFRYGTDERHAEYSAIKSALFNACDYMAWNGYFSLAIPKIGCGLGGADEELVKEIVRGVEKESGDVEITWVTYQK